MKLVTRSATRDHSGLTDLRPARFQIRLLIAVLTAAWLAWLLVLPPRPPWWVASLSGLPILAFASYLLHRGRAESWRAFVRHTADLHALAVILLAALGLQFEDAHGVTTDGVIYFSQLRSVIFEGDLNVADEFAYLGQPPRPYHVVPIGPTFVWLPLYLVVTAVDAAGQVLGLWTPPAEPIAAGLTLPYVRAALVSSFVIGAIGLVVLQCHLRGEFGRRIAFATTVLVLGGTSLFWYLVYEPSMTHAASFGFVALFVAGATRWTSLAITRRQAVTLGALLGAAFLSRPQEAIFVLLPAVLLATTTASWAARLRAGIRFASWGLIGALPFLIVQAVHSSILFRRERFSLVGTEGYLDPFNSRWDDTLWSSWHGFLSWSPVAYFAVIGTIAYLARRRRWAAAGLLILFVMAWINGSTADWPAGWSFGGRRFTSCLVILAPGLAFLLQLLAARPMIPVALAAAAAIAWNQLLIAQFDARARRLHDPPPYGELVRGQAAQVTRRPFFYPFAFPANLWFAWRTGLPVESYDLLAPEELRNPFTLTFGATATPFLMDGWGPRASDEWSELRWMERTRAELVVPLARGAARGVIFEIQWRTRLVEPLVTTPVTVSVNGVGIATFEPDARALAISSVTESDMAWWKHGFNRVVLTRPEGSPPVAVYRVVVQ